jgi:cob(I)alamin adenosyltransferase
MAGIRGTARLDKPKLILKHTASEMGGFVKKGYVHIYTGNGKGKTTAAIGLAVRAVGSGMRVWFGQFCKGNESGEHNALRCFKENITVRQFGKKCGFITGTPTQEDMDIAACGLAEAREAMVSDSYSLVILDEACMAAYLNLCTADALCELILEKPGPVEMVLTGRYASQRLIDCADLVTEMKEIKHYYTRGRTARKGIEK